MTRSDVLRAVPPATYFVAVQFYTSLEALSPTPGVGFTLLHRTGAALLAALLAASALACGALLVRDRLRPPRSAPSTAILTAWIGAALVSTLFAVAPLDGAQLVLTMLLAALFHVAVLRYYGRRAVARAVVTAYLVAGGLAASAGIAMVVSHVPLGLYAAAHGRAAGPFVTANQFAEFLDLFVFVSLGTALAARPSGLRAAAAAATALGAVALAATFSREGWTGAAAGAIFLAAVLGRRRMAWSLVALAAIAAAGLALRPFSHHDPSDTFSRVRTMQAGVRVAQLFPLTGVGPVDYWRVYPAVRAVNGPLPGTFGALHPHNMYVSLLGETGMVGLAAGAFGWLCFVRAMRRRLSTAAPSARRFSSGICAGLVALMVAGLLDTIAVVQMTFVWIPYTALALAAATEPFPWAEVPAR